MIETRRLSKTYGAVAALRDVTFAAAPGRVTGFLGLNGSGKTTTLRLLLGLARPTSGEALINGRRYRELRRPLREVGAVLEQGVAHPGLTGRGHLRTQAPLAGANGARVDQVLEYVGLGDAARTRTGEYSLGMRQRLAVATALLGEPPVLILDEPANGLDPAGVAWLRGLLRSHAEAGGTVLLSSHLLGELELLVDDVVIIADGEVRLAAPLAQLTGSPRLRVRGADLRTLYDAFTGYGGYIETDGSALFVEGLTAEQAGDIALAVQVPIYELTVETVSLEAIFFELAAAR
ncbi:ATP-binding cassette domain-containing protein [Actinoplanes subtropicus]|uniref:ATP-binding cassette domain-containing protein n=1 Tax=Actinoplanes subtropicus TaxID=543632 RepID=UPI0004C3010E|nr:ATP-binding cassette domain-containing protein [Actinoplanes subtropicus]